MNRDTRGQQTSHIWTWCELLIHTDLCITLAQLQLENSHLEVTNALWTLASAEEQILDSCFHLVIFMCVVLASATHTCINVVYTSITHLHSCIIHIIHTVQ